MNYGQYLRAQLFADSKNIQRDPMLKWFILLPFLLAIVLRLLFPLVQMGLDQIPFDLSPYYDLIISLYMVLMIPMLLGVIVGFMLLDEKDEQTLLALQVSPLSIQRYIMYRVFTPMLLSYPMLLITIPIVGDYTSIKFIDLMLVSILGALWAPFLGLILSVFANNKVEGFAIMKLLGGAFVLPLAAFFVPQPWDLVFVFFPSYWPMKAFLLAANGESYIVYLLGGIVMMIVPLYLVVKYMRKKVFE
ncbi:MAG: ABC transporter [Candidatus Heimdallarchaeota archaeon]|nr:ABC transporter [Candidatus Heimdallarchaeota archaeon]